MTKAPINPAPVGLKDIVNENDPTTPIATEMAPSRVVGNNLNGANNVIQGGPATGPNGVPGQICFEITDPSTAAQPADEQTYKNMGCIGPNGYPGPFNDIVVNGDPAVIPAAEIIGNGVIRALVDAGIAGVTIPQDPGTFIPGALLIIQTQDGNDVPVTGAGTATILQPAGLNVHPAGGSGAYMFALRYLGAQNWIHVGLTSFAGGV